MKHRISNFKNNLKKNIIFSIINFVVSYVNFFIFFFCFFFLTFFQQFNYFFSFFFFLSNSNSICVFFTNKGEGGRENKSCWQLRRNEKQNEKLKLIKNFIDWKIIIIKIINLYLYLHITRFFLLIFVNLSFMLFRILLWSD